MQCNIHGPYDGPECPYCAQEAGRQAGGAPAAPPPLNDDYLETDMGPMQTEAAYARGFGDNDDTDPPIPRGGNPRRGGMGRADPLDEDQTYIPHRKGGGGGDDDQTQINYKREPRKQQGPLGFLIESVGPRRGRVYRIEDGTIVGRTTGDLLIDDADISRSHARFRLEEEQFTLTDFASENGTFVNGEKIRAETPLIENDVIEMGSRTFVFKVLLGTGKPAKKKKKAAG